MNCCPCVQATGPTLAEPASKLRSLKPHGSALPRIATWPKLIFTSAVLGGLAMLAPSSPMVDSWHWLRWGRQLGSMKLDVTGSWSGWKPLAVPFTTLYAAAGDAAPDLLVWTMRSAAFFTVALAAALPVMLARRSSLVAARAHPAVVAGSATAALLAVRLVLGSSGNGSSEPLVDALLLAGVACAVQGRARTALGLLLIAGTGRPEALAAAAVIAALQWKAHPETRLMAVIGPGIVLAAWLVPDWLGSGQPGHMLDINRGWLMRPDLPPEYVDFAAGLKVAAQMPTGIGIAVMLSGVGAAAADWRRGGRYPAAAAGCGAAWVAMWLATGILGSPPMPRYIQPALLLLAALGGFGVAAAIGWAGAAISSWRPLEDLPTGAVQWCAGIGLIVVTALPIMGQMQRTNRIATQGEAAIKSLDAVLAATGGTSGIRSCGPIARNSEQDGLLAWRLRVDMGAFSASGGPDDPGYRLQFRAGTTFRFSGPGPFGAPRRQADIAPEAKVVARSGGWTVWQACRRPTGRSPQPMR